MTVDCLVTDPLGIHLGILTPGVMIATAAIFSPSAEKRYCHHQNGQQWTPGSAEGTGTLAWMYYHGGGGVPAFCRNGAHVYLKASSDDIGLINLGPAIRTARQAKLEAVRRLLFICALKTARVIRDGQEQDLAPLEQVRKGDQIRRSAGEQLPVDGVVREGKHAALTKAMAHREPIAGQ